MRVVEPVALLPWKRVTQLQQHSGCTDGYIVGGRGPRGLLRGGGDVIPSLSPHAPASTCVDRTTSSSHVTSQMVLQAVATLLPFRPTRHIEYSSSYPEVFKMHKFRSVVNPQFP